MKELSDGSSPWSLSHPQTQDFLAEAADIIEQGKAIPSVPPEFLNYRIHDHNRCIIIKAPVHVGNNPDAQEITFYVEC